MVQDFWTNHISTSLLIWQNIPNKFSNLRPIPNWLLISRFQVQVLMGARLAGNLKLSAGVIGSSPDFQFAEQQDLGIPSWSKGPHVSATVGHAPDSHPDEVIPLPLLPWIHARVWVLCNHTSSAQTSCWQSVHSDVPNVDLHSLCLIPRPPLICPTNSFPPAVLARLGPRHPYGFLPPNHLCWWSWSSFAAPLTISDSAVLLPSLQSDSRSRLSCIMTYIFCLGSLCSSPAWSGSVLPNRTGPSSSLFWVLWAWLDVLTTPVLPTI